MTYLVSFPRPAHEKIDNSAVFATCVDSVIRCKTSAFDLLVRAAIKGDVQDVPRDVKASHAPKSNAHGLVLELLDVMCVPIVDKKTCKSKLWPPRWPTTLPNASNVRFLSTVVKETNMHEDIGPNKPLEVSVNSLVPQGPPQGYPRGGWYRRASKGQTARIHSE